jgi:heme-degrading monooxygenase HmoA
VITVGLYYDVYPEKAALFEEKFAEVLRVMDGIPGHRASYLYHRVDDPNSYAILSEWDDQGAFESFIRSETFRNVTSWGLSEVLRHPPRHKVYPRADDLRRPGA